MEKVAIIVLADTESHADSGRVTNALVATKELKEAHDEVKLIFDGAGTQWVSELCKPEHMLHGLYASVSDKVAGACGFCAQAFHAKEKVTACHVPLLEEYAGHPSFKKLIAGGYQIITF